jgi:hypothetical protein
MMIVGILFILYGLYEPVGKIAYSRQQADEKNKKIAYPIIGSKIMISHRSTA